jgi:DUF1365 family protein
MGICASTLLAGCAAGLLGLVIGTPFVLATVAVARQKTLPRNSSLYVGRVWHTRYLPVRHAFTYPFFLFGVYLDEIEHFHDSLWPLSMIMRLEETDHLKNGEGLCTDKDHENSLQDRIFAYCAEKTNQKFLPTPKTHQVLLLTHLKYYGYCFNPVSFYQILNRSTGGLDAVVGEVSNTPWNEMHAYVLHADSVDNVAVTLTRAVTNYVFPKVFHVSPFMEMNYWYDWTFGPIDRATIYISNAMKQKDDADDKVGALQFHASVKLQAYVLSPYHIASQLAVYPVYCAIIQVWIHYQAFWLFLKGVPFQPHPDGSETTASKVIGAIMTPFFKLYEWRRRSDREGGGSGPFRRNVHISNQAQ